MRSKSHPQHCNFPTLHLSTVVARTRATTARMATAENLGNMVDLRELEEMEEVVNAQEVLAMELRKQSAENLQHFYTS